MTRAELVEVVARAIAGPFYQPPSTCPLSLEALRDVRWTAHLTGAERSMKMQQATAALAAIEAAGLVCVPREATAEQVGKGIQHMRDAGGKVRLAETYRAMISASPLAQEPGR